MTSLSRREMLATLGAIGSATATDQLTGVVAAEILTAVVDRIEDDVAAVLVEREGVAVGERHLPLARVPAAAREAGTVLELTVEGDRVVDVRIDRTATERRRAAAERRFERLTAG